MDLRDYVLMFNTVWLVLISVLTWLRKPGEAAVAALDALNTKVDNANNEHRNRLMKIETDLKHMPNSDELTELEGNVKAINERTEGLIEAISTVRSTLARIETYLLTSKR